MKCFTCKYYAWWDGDFCCLKDFTILEHAPDGIHRNNIKYNCDKYVEISSMHKKDEV